MVGFSYDHPNYVTHREWYAGEAGGAGATEYGRWHPFQKAKLEAVHFVVTTAGTAAGHKFDVQIGTASVGSVTLGTSAAGETSSVTSLSAESVSSLAKVTVKSGADTVGKALVIYEWLADPSGAASE